MNNTIQLNQVRSFRAGLRGLERELVASLRDETGCCGVGLLQCHVLLELENADGLSLKDIETRLGTDKASLSRSVDGMVAAGLMERRENQNDRRAVVISLSESGRRKVEEINRLTDEKYVKVLDSLPSGVRNAVIRTILELGKALAGCRDQDKSGCCGRGRNT